MIDRSGSTYGAGSRHAYEYAGSKPGRKICAEVSEHLVDDLRAGSTNVFIDGRAFGRQGRGY